LPMKTAELSPLLHTILSGKRDGAIIDGLRLVLNHGD